MADLLKKVLSKEFDRRTFLKGGAAVTAAAALGLSLAGTENSLVMAATPAQDEADGKWITAACWHNCGGRCLNKALVVDGVVVRQKTDDTHPDTPDFPQQRACQRGRSQRQQIFGADRLKYPMKRKHWEPLTGGNKSLRGQDEWVRISWDEALDLVAAELKNVKEKYGNRSIVGYSSGAMMNAFGGLTTVNDTTSYGVYAYVSGILGIPVNGFSGSNDRFDLRKSETIVMYGNNPAWSSLGSPSYHYYQAKKAGAKFISVGPSKNFSAELLDAKWIRVRPGTDTAFLLAVAYTMVSEDNTVTNPIVDWDFMHRCTVGFDSNHMPDDAKVNENIKDYLLGRYDGIPKTPEWAHEICGTPVEDIVWFAREMRKDKKVALLYGTAPARCNNADDFPQAILLVGALGGHMGKPGHACGASVHNTSSNNGSSLVSAGGTGVPAAPANPVDDVIMGPELWNTVLTGKYRRTAVARTNPADVDDREIDIHMIYYGTTRNALQTVLGAAKGVEAHRKVDFVVANAYALTAVAKYADIVLPITTEWERPGTLLTGNREILIYAQQVVQPMYETKSDQEIQELLCGRLGLDKDELYPLNEGQQLFNRLVGCTYVDKNGQKQPLLTITAQDVAEWSEKWGKVEAPPQQGLYTLQEFSERGIYQAERYEGDKYTHIQYEAFVKDPEGAPLSTPSGKFELYCQTKADMINVMNRSTIKPYPTYIAPLNGYEQSFSDWDNKVKGEYPYQLTNPHYPRRSHTILDNLPWLREALPNPVFISAYDAEELDLKDGDVVLISSAHGRAVRPVSISERIMPGVVELPHGTWMDIDESTGIDKSGSDNYIGAPETSGCGVSGYNTQLVKLEKYNGTLLPDVQWPQRVINI